MSFLVACQLTFTFGFFSKIANGIWVGGLPTGGNVSEMSVQYNEYLGQYVVLYTDGGNNVVMRVSESPQGEWSDTTTLVRNNLTTDTGMYAPMVHPMSGTDYFNTTDADVGQNEVPAIAKHLLVGQRVATVHLWHDAHPPAMAGTIVSSSPSWTAASKPPWKRMSSSFR